MTLMEKCFYVCSQFPIRTYKIFPKTKRFNPGLDKRLRLFKQSDIEKRKIDEETLDNLEQDVNNADSIGTLHTREIKKMQNKIMLKQVERTYFKKQKLPNMLLWSEKEQIRLLSQSDPDLWTPRKLSECFPATAETVIKLLKSQWKPVNNERIAAHDKAVCANWRAFHMGKINFPDHFATHLKQFTSRTETVQKSVEMLSEKPEIKRKGEFRDIIHQYKELIDATETKSSKTNPLLESGEDNSFLHRNVSKSTFKGKNYSLLSTGNIVNKKELMVVSPQTLMRNENGDNANLTKGFLNESSLENLKSDNDTNVIEIESKSQKGNIFHEDIKMEIKIPKEKWKKGSLYKVNNCYYTDDGEFLYRV